MECSGHGGRALAAMAGSVELVGAADWLGIARRGAEGVTGRVAVHDGGLYSRSWARRRWGLAVGPTAHGDARGRWLGARWRVVSRRTHGSVHLPEF
jgi:hypothetical protein